MKIPASGSSQFLRRLGRLMCAGLAMLLAAGMSPACMAAEGNKQVVHLFFADPTKPFLVGEQRVMVNPKDPSIFGRQLVQELINGPADGGRLATIPNQTSLRSFFLLEDGTAVVDFSVHFRDNHPGGCRWEQLTLFSVVNSLVLNEPAIDRVKILIDGAEYETLAGHIPLEFPLTADLLLTR